MTSRFLHPSYYGKLGEPESITPADPPQPPTAPRLDVSVLIGAERSCCCTANPVVMVMMPPAPGREHETDLLFCMHHYRACAHALAAAGAVAADRSGQLLQPPERPRGAQVVTATLVAVP